MSNVPKCKQTAVGLSEKSRLLGKLCSGRSSSASGHEFNDNELAMWYIQKKEKEIH